MRESEKATERYLVRRCAEEGWKALKYTNGNERGYPDRIVLTGDGGAAWVEVKSSDGYPTPLQQLRIAFLRERGYIAEIARGKEDVERIILRLKMEGIRN